METNTHTSFFHVNSHVLGPKKTTYAFDSVNRSSWPTALANVSSAFMVSDLKSVDFEVRPTEESPQICIEFESGADALGHELPEPVKPQKVNPVREAPQPSKYEKVAYGSHGWEDTGLWTIQRFLKKKWVGFVVGSPGCMKTFIVLRMAQCLANGEVIAGCQIEQGDVHLVAAEGGDGIKCRLHALEELYGSVDERISFSFRSVDLRKPEHVTYLESVFAEHEERTGNPISLLVLDTLSVNAIGMDENSATDTGEFFACCAKFAAEHDVAIVLVHHLGKDGDIRGSSTMKGNIDFIWKVQRVEDHSRMASELVVERCKEDVTNCGIRFDFEVFDTGLKDQWGIDAITTLRVVKEEFFRSEAKTQGGGRSSQKAKKISQTELDSNWILEQISFAGSSLSLTELKALYSEITKIAPDNVYQRLRRAYLNLENLNKIRVTKTENETFVQMHNSLLLDDR